MKNEPPDVPLSAYRSTIKRLLDSITDAKTLRKIYRFIISIAL